MGLHFVVENVVIQIHELQSCPSHPADAYSRLSDLEELEIWNQVFVEVSEHVAVFQVLAAESALFWVVIKLENSLTKFIWIHFNDFVQ